MKFDMSAAPECKLRGDEVEIGDVYPNQKGGVFVIVGKSGGTCYYIRLNERGEVTGSGQYGEHALLRKALLGRADLPTNIHVEWFE